MVFKYFLVKKLAIGLFQVLYLRKRKKRLDTMKNNHEQLMDVFDTLKIYATILTGDKDRADDLLQNTLLRILQNIDEYRAIGRFEVWAKKVMLNVFRNEVRNSSYRTMHFIDGYDYHDEEHATYSYAAESDSVYNAKELMNVIGKLPKRQSKAIAMRADGYLYNEIAERLGMSISNVKQAIFTARGNIKRMLEE